MAARDAHEAFERLAPRLREISTAVRDGALPARERMELANMLLGYFTGVATEARRADLRLVDEMPHDIAS